MVNWEQHFRQMKRGQRSVHFGADIPSEEHISFGGITTPEDLRAIREYFGRTAAITPEAVKIKTDFVKWYDDLGPLDVFSESVYDLARNQRNTFNLANVRTPAERASVEDQMKTGMSTEQQQGEPDRRLPTGMLPGPTKPPLKIPTYVWIIVGVAAGVVVIFLVLKTTAKVARIATPML
jgi:hypothetical protein